MQIADRRCYRNPQPRGRVKPGRASCAHDTVLLSAALINQRDKIYRADIPQKSRIGTLSRSRAVARNLQARRISAVPAPRRFVYSSMKLSLTIPDLPWQRAVFPFHRLAYLSPLVGIAYSDHFSIAYRALWNTLVFCKFSPLKDQRWTRKFFALALHVAAFDRSRTRIGCIPNASIMFIGGVRRFSNIFIPRQYAIPCLCSQLIQILDEII